MRRAAAVLALVLAGCGGPTRTVTRTTTVRTASPAAAADPSFDPAVIYEQEAPGVVTVISIFGSLDDGGLGSGFVVSKDGEIVTNAHVVTSGESPDITQAKQVYVTFADRNRVPAKVVGYDPDADVALLHVDPDGLALRPLPVGTSTGVPVGSPVAAMGSPFGEEQSLSVGIVSAVGRDVESLTRFRISGAIQTDAAVNPGNSGGPLVDAAGRVIGINQQIQSKSGGGEGVGFAVPIDLVKRSVAQLRKDGHVEYAYVGVASAEVYPQLAERFHLPVKHGAWLQSLQSGSPAAHSGLKGGGRVPVEFQAERYFPGGDVVTAIDGDAVRDSSDFAQRIAAHRPGDTVAFEVHRGDRTLTVRVKLGKRPVGAGR